ncbi:MAG: hypothetical protein WCS09_21315, partial [Pseudomonadota bacterium]
MHSDRDPYLSSHRSARPDASRRRLLGGTAALGALSVAGCATTSTTGSGLPSRGEWLVRGGHVMT